MTVATLKTVRVVCLRPNPSSANTKKGRKYTLRSYDRAILNKVGEVNDVAEPIVDVLDGRGRFLESSFRWRFGRPLKVTKKTTKKSGNESGNGCLKKAARS